MAPQDVQNQGQRRPQVSNEHAQVRRRQDMGVWTTPRRTRPPALSLPPSAVGESTQFLHTTRPTLRLTAAAQDAVSMGPMSAPPTC